MHHECVSFAWINTVGLDGLVVGQPTLDWVARPPTWPIAIHIFLVCPYIHIVIKTYGIC
jgi:hypothetical protein